MLSKNATNAHKIAQDLHHNKYKTLGREGKEGKQITAEDHMRLDSHYRSGLHDLVEKNLQGERVFGESLSKKSNGKSKGYAMIEPSKADIESFKNAILSGKIEGDVLEFNNSNNVNSLDDNKIVEMMLNMNENSEIDINNSIFDDLSPKTLIIPTLLEPKRPNFGIKKVFNIGDKGIPKTEVVTIDDYVNEHPVLRQASIDAGFKSITLSDYSLTGGNFARQNAEFPTNQTDRSQAEKIGSTGSESANLFAQSGYIETTEGETKYFTSNNFYNTFDPYTVLAQRNREALMLSCQVDAICGNGNPGSNFNSFAKQVGEAPSDALLAGLLSVGQTDIFASMTDENFETAINRIGSYVAIQNSLQQPNFMIDTLYIPDYQELSVALFKPSVNFAINGSSYELVSSMSYLTRLMALELILQIRLGINDFKVLPAPFYRPNNLATASYNNPLVGKNPFGNRPCALLCSRNRAEDDRPQYMYKNAIKSSIGNHEFVDYMGTRCMSQMIVYSECKVLNPASRVLIAPPVI